MKNELQIPKTVKIPGRWRFFWVALIGFTIPGNGASYPGLYGNNEAAYIADNSGKYARHKHEYLLANYPNYAAANVDIEAFIHQYGADVYLAATVLYEGFMEEVGEDTPKDAAELERAAGVEIGTWTRAILGENE